MYTYSWYNIVMKIGNIELKNNLILAPMAGVTDMAFRSLAIECGADYGVTEMVSAKAMSYDNKKTFDLLKLAPNESIKVVQIFGDEPDTMADMCKVLAKDFDIIDINMGCPAPKIVKNNSGSALMKNIDLAYSIVKACAESVDIPITVKFRKGFDDSNVNAVEFAKMCEKAGAKAITIHGRTREQYYEGKVDLDIIKAVKEAVNIPVIANGDVCDYESYKHMLEYTHADAVMIGRGALGNPNVFADILGGEKKDKLYFIKKHIAILRENYSDNFVVGHMRKHILWYLKGEQNANAVKVQVSTEKDIDKVIDIVTEFFKKVQE